MKARRVGCRLFGLIWAVAFGLTNFVMAVGDPVDDRAANSMTAAFWIELAVLVVGAMLFYRAEKRDSEI